VKARVGLQIRCGPRPAERPPITAVVCPPLTLPRLARLLKFAGVSGAGLCLDYAIYALLCSADVPAGWANLASAGAGVSFVFAVSARRIFESSDRFLLGLFAAYAVYQVIAVSAASWAVGALDGALDGRYLVAKTLVLPCSFTANYLFMTWLFATRGRTPAAVA
jgi:putative flippase GtrA